MLTCLHDATLIDGTGQILENHSLLINDQTIQALGPTETLQIPAKAKVYPLAGKYVLPGIIDAHIHLDMHGLPDTYHESLVEHKLRTIRSAIEMSNTVRAGVTTVRNMGSAHLIDIAVKRAVKEELIVGPRILACGKIISMTAAGNGYFPELYRQADGIDENRKAAREQLQGGADLLKIMATGAIMNPGGVPGAPLLDIDEMRAVVKEGKKEDKHTAAHAHGAQGIKNSVKAGVRTIEHGTLADEDALKLMADSGVYLISTLSSNFWMVRSAGKKGIPKFMFEKAEEISKIRVETLNKALDLGVKVVMGTDAGTPYNYHGKNCMELVQYVDKGIMSPMEAIVASTGTAAEAVGLGHCTGTLQPGKAADCLVLKQDPLENINCLLDLDCIHMIFKEGALIKGEVDTQQWNTSSPLGL
jgi:imidazolonepropionase-like amidohydrolase